MEKDEFTMSVPEAGRRLGLGKNASYEAARRGELPVLRFGRKLTVPIVAFERMLREANPKDHREPDSTARERLDARHFDKPRSDSEEAP